MTIDDTCYSYFFGGGFVEFAEDCGTESSWRNSVVTGFKVLVPEMVSSVSLKLNRQKLLNNQI